ncbi:MAG: nuclear transport factor 2 family protein [Candidatus Tumulicola sp.]
MKKSLFFVLALALTAAGSSGSTARAASSDSAAITALYKQFAAVFEHKDLNGIMSLYVPNDSLFVFDVGPPREHRGWNDYREDWKALFAGFKDNPTFEIIDFGMTIDGDVAYTHSAQRISANTGAKTRTTVVVRVTDVLRKINGKWLIVEEHVSIPVDLNTMKPDPLSKT